MYYIHTDTTTSKKEVELHSQSDKTITRRNEINETRIIVTIGKSNE